METPISVAHMSLVKGTSTIVFIELQIWQGTFCSVLQIWIKLCSCHGKLYVDSSIKIKTELLFFSNQISAYISKSTEIRISMTYTHSQVHRWLQHCEDVKQPNHTAEDERAAMFSVYHETPWPKRSLLSMFKNTGEPEGHYVMSSTW